MRCIILCLILMLCGTRYDCTRMEQDTTITHKQDICLIKRRKPINRKTKLNIVFDENSRRDFLTGFHRRKLGRKKKAEEELQKWIKEEKKRIKKEAKEEIKKLVLTNRPIPELEHLHSEEYDLPTHTVSVVEYSSEALEGENHWIGLNKVEYETDKEDTDNKEEPRNNLPGMDLKSNKDLKKAIKHQATKQVQKSKAFQTKQRIEKKKQLKKSHKNKHERVKARMKKQKFKSHR